MKRRLGQDGPLVGAIGLGCWSFGNAYGPTSEAESHRTLSKALDLGLDFLDTANVYGMGVSEDHIGSFLRNRSGAFKIATKAGITRTPDKSERIFVNTADHLSCELEESLKRLGVDCVDLFYIHRRDPNLEIEAVMETLVRFKEEGKIRGIGFSEISPGSLRRAHAVHPVMAVQSEYSLWVRMPDLGMIQACRDLGVSFVAFSPLGRGVFTETPPPPGSIPDGDFRRHNPRFVEPNYNANLSAIKRFQRYAAERGVWTSALALAWVLHQGNHVIPIPGTRKADHLEQNAAALSLQLTPDDLKEIDAILPVGFAHGDRYSEAQMVGVERYC
ncbi:MAG: aldo/keto reductase [Pseudomonadota bacterium]